MSEPKPIKDAADLLSRFPISGRHYRHNYALYAAPHVLQFAKECSRVAAEKMKLAILDELEEELRIMLHADTYEWKEIVNIVHGIKTEEIIS